MAKKNNVENVENVNNVENVENVENVASVNPLNILQNIGNNIQSAELPQDAHLQIDKETSIIKKEYTFAIPKGKRGQVAINDPDVILSVERIKAAQYGQNIMAYVIAKEFSRLAEKSDTIVAMGFNDVADFGATLFGYKSNTVNQYIRIGKYFIGDNYAPLPFLPSTMSISGMIELLAPASDKDGNVDVKKVVKWYSDGTLVDGMSKAKIRQALKELNKPALEEGNEGKDDKADKADKADKTDKADKADAVSIIDRLNDMTPDVAAGNALNALEILSAIYDKFCTTEGELMGAKVAIDRLAQIARDMVK